MIYGYARVSRVGQDVDRQIHRLTEAGVEKIYKETVSGAKTDRKELRRLLARIGEGDTLIVTRLCRLVRSTRDLLNVLDELSSKGAAFRSLAEDWANTSTAHGRLTITILGGLAEFERSLIADRMEEGRKAARRGGVVFGRKPKLTPFQIREALERMENGETTRSIARTYNVTQSTISRLRKRE